MDDAGTIRVTRALRATSLLLACCAIAIFAFRSLAGPLWLDELLTMTLVQADSLPRLWSGIIAGIDGNPPLYLTAAWLIVHAMPRAVSSVAALELTNFALTMAATVALYRVGRRVASATACWIGTFLFAALNDNLIHVAVELRTYALYFFMAALAVLFQQRLIERHRPARRRRARAVLCRADAGAHVWHRLCRLHRARRRAQPASRRMAPLAAYRRCRHPRDRGAGGLDAVLCPAERGRAALYVGRPSGPSRSARKPVRIEIVDVDCDSGTGLPCGRGGRRAQAWRIATTYGFQRPGMATAPISGAGVDRNIRFHAGGMDRIGGAVSAVRAPLFHAPTDRRLSAPYRVLRMADAAGAAAPGGPGDERCAFMQPLFRRCC